MPVVDSSQSGYLAPGPPPAYDTALEDIFQAVCVGISGLPGNMVRPKWQPQPANSPDQSANWAAVGVEIKARQWDAVQEHDPNAAGGDGESTISGNELLQVTFSFYGPGSQGFATILRDGMSVTQNRDALVAQGIKFVEFMEPVNLPALLKDSWGRRVDLKAHFTRIVQRTYSIRNFASASGTIDNERYITPWSANNQPSP